jgi:hypothetical protein
VKERPILFSAPMVRALLDGSKTQTRRVIKPHPRDDAFCLLDHGDGWWPYRSEDGESANVDNMEYPFACPHGQPGDRLWVRETWAARPDYDHVPPLQCGDEAIWWRASLSAHPEGYAACFGKWRPSIHMPRWASRILLEVVSVRVERLNDCSEADAVAEGCTKNHNGYYWGGPHPVNGTKQMATARKAYCDLWESINGAGSWAANPWVWVVEFKRVMP